MKVICNSLLLFKFVSLYSHLLSLHFWSLSCFLKQRDLAESFHSFPAQASEICAVGESKKWGKSEGGGGMSLHSEVLWQNVKVAVLAAELIRLKSHAAWCVRHGLFSTALQVTDKAVMHTVDKAWEEK